MRWTRTNLPRGWDEPHTDRISFYIADYAVEFFGASNGVIVGFVLPEWVAGSVQDLIGVSGCGAF